jgi:predicted Fe-S protein YdhL (DUF1289 family)
MPSDPNGLIETPCLKICALEPGSMLCRGCGRTVTEIAGWGAMSVSERRRVMALLPDRIATIGSRAKLDMGEPASPAPKE